MKAKIKLIEDVHMEDCIPDKNRMISLLIRREDYEETNGQPKSAISNPYLLAKSTKNEAKHIQNLIAGIVLDWPALIEAEKKELLGDRYNWQPDDIKAVCAHILRHNIHEQLAKAVEAAMETRTTYAAKHSNVKEMLQEAAEKHDTLNQKLFGEDDKLKPEVLEKINEIVSIFIDSLAESDIKLILKDIILIGSNVSYNYNKHSDLDIHIIADTAALECPDNLYPALYSAYRCIFNKNFDIDFYGIPVEIYVETDETNTISNGIYSVLNNDWIKFPTKEAVPETDQKALADLVAPWEARCKAVLNNPKTTADDIDQLIEDIYKQRAEGLADTGEYDLKNLLFKELRNEGYLDRLKEYKYEVMSKELSLESLHEELAPEILDNYRTKLSQIAFQTPVIYKAGNFEFHNVKERDVDQLLTKLQRLDDVYEVRKFASGKYDFSRINPVTNMPAQYFTVCGRIYKKEDK